MITSFHFRENYVQTELHVDRIPIPARTHSNAVGPTDWNEALDIISYGSPEQVCVNISSCLLLCQVLLLLLII